MRVLSIFFLLFISCSIQAVEYTIPVRVESTTNDLVGRRLAYSVKEEIRKSQAYTVTESNELGMVVSIVTLDGFESHQGSQTIYSVVWSWNNPENLLPFFLTSHVGYCGANRVRECAEGLTATTDEQAAKVIRLLNKYLE